MSFWAVAMLEEDGGYERGGFALLAREGRWGGHFGVFIDNGAETLLDVADAVRIFSLVFPIRQQASEHTTRPD